MLKRGWRDIVIVAAGPSLDVDQVAQITDAHAGGLFRLIVINTTWEKFPRADALVAADHSWWTEYLPAVRARFAGELWTQDTGTVARLDGRPWADVAREWGISTAHAVEGDFLPAKPETVCLGSNSGHLAIGIAAALFGMRRGVLVAFDMMREKVGPSHHHGDHPGTLANGNPRSWVPRFTPLARDLEAAGIQVVNASKATALTQFRRVTLGEALQEIQRSTGRTPAASTL